MIGAGALLGGRYRLVARIGSGGMGTVWQGTDQVLDRPVAVKVLADDPQAQVGAEAEGDARWRARLRREARAAARLSHPNVASVHDYGEDAATGVVFIVMELLAGETLATRLGRDGALPPPLAAGIGAQVAAALAAAHQGGVVHRDVKPGNVFLTRAGVVKVLDFGIAATASEAGGRRSEALSDGFADPWDRSGGPPVHGHTSGPQPDLLVGTPAYIAPELAAGKPAGPAVDVYALGVLLYEALAGRPPFQADDPLALVSAHATQAPPPLSRVPGVPLGLAAACEWAMDKDPARRPSAAELASTLAALVPAAATRTVAGFDLGPGFDPDRTVVTGPGEGPAGIQPEGVGPAGPAHTARLPLAELGAVLAGGNGGDGDHAGPDSETTVLEWPRAGSRERRRRGVAVGTGLLALLLIAGVAVAWPRGHGQNTAARTTQPVTTVAVTSTTEAQGDQPFAPGAFVGAVGQVWQAIMNARNAGQLRPDVATDFGNLLQQLQHDLQQGQDPHDLQKQLNHLNRKVNQRLKEGAITSRQAADQIHAALQQLAATLGIGAGDNGNGDGGD